MRCKNGLRLLVTAVTAILLVISLAACGGTDNREENEKKEDKKSLFERGLDVIDLMVEATRNEDYMRIYTASGEMLEILKEIGEGDYEEPDKVLSVTGDTELYTEVLELAEVEGLSKELEENLSNRMFSSMITQLNAQAGANYLAASSVCSMGKGFVDEDVKDKVIYIYIYEDATWVAVTFIPGEDDIVSASGCFLMNDYSIEELESVFEELGMEVEEIL